MKLSKWGICSRSEGTSVEPSRAGSRWKCVLSKMMVTTCWTFRRGELSWQLPAGVAGAGCACAGAGYACAGAGYAAGRTGARRNANEIRSDVQRRAVSLTYALKRCNFLFLELERTFMTGLYLHGKDGMQNSADYFQPSRLPRGLLGE